MNFIYRSCRIRRSNLIINRLRLLSILSSNISTVVLLLVIDEFLFIEFTILEITDKHMLGFVGNLTFVANVGTSQSIVTRNHHAFYLSTLQLSNRALGLRLQLVLEHLEAIENQLALCIRAGDGLQLPLSDRLARDGQHSETM